MQPRHVAVGPHIVDERLHHFPQQRWRRPWTPRPGRTRGRDRARLGRRLQHTATTAQRRGRLGPRIVRRSLLYQRPAVPARVNRGRRGLQQRPRRILIAQAEHLTGHIMTGVGRKTRRQYRQTRGQTITSGHHGAARSEQRLRINRQGNHAQNSRPGPRAPPFTQTPPSYPGPASATTHSSTPRACQATGTTTSSCGRLLTARAPSSVTTTMSSMRAPHRPGK